MNIDISRARRPRAAVAVTLAIGFCSGCAVAPDWLRDQGARTLRQAEPRELRVAVELPRPLQPRPNATSLEFELVPRDGAVSHKVRLPLVLVNEGRTLRAGGLASARSGYFWYLFKLTSDGEAGLADLQVGLRADPEAFHRQYRRVGLAVRTAVRDAQPGQVFSHSVWLQPRVTDEFRALVRDREMRHEAEPDRD